MRFGVCVPPDKIDILARAGYDFCELPASAVRPFDDDAAALPALRAIADNTASETDAASA